MKFLLSISFVILFSAFSGFGQGCIGSAKIVAPVMDDATRTQYGQKLADAKAAYAQSPGDPDKLIWLGRRTAYLGKYPEAIRIFTEGIAKHSRDARLFRHRGHRHLTIRCFDEAIKDFETAAKLVKGKKDEIEPDGLPNARNLPTSTLQSNIWYHLGLAHYVKGDFKRAANAYKEAMKVSKNNDMLAATSHWYYMSLRRLEKNRDAERLLEPIDGDFEVVENNDYLRLLRMYRDEVKADALLDEIKGNSSTLGNASIGYGLGAWFLYNGDKSRAAEIFSLVTAGNQWASFGYIAAEADLQRLR